MRQSMIRQQIDEWLYNTTFTEFHNEIKKRVIGQSGLKIVTANVYNYLKNVVASRPVNNNMLLTAPSGSGKTETYRALRDYFRNYIPDMPIYTFDTSLLTASGYKGAEPYEICTPFFEMGVTDAIGICFLDEFDKKIAPSYNNQGMDTNAEAQSNMLTIVEGTMLNGRNGGVVDTSNIMFVGLGSFDEFRKKRETTNKPLGFENKETEIPDHYEPVDRNAMVECGGLYELLGRFPIIVNYTRLSSECLHTIIEKTVSNIEDSFMCDIVLTENMMTTLMNIANSKFGCRLFDSMIRSAVLSIYGDALELEEKYHTLVITIDSPENVSFIWREYNDIEILEEKNYEEFVNKIKNSIPRDTMSLS